MIAAKVEAQEMEKKTIALLEESKMPVSIGYVAYKLNVCWQTARSLLFKLSMNGKISPLETSKGYLFEAKN